MTMNFKHCMLLQFVIEMSELNIPFSEGENLLHHQLCLEFDLVA